MPNHTLTHTHIRTHHMKAVPRRNAPWLTASFPPPSSSSWLRSDGRALPLKSLKEKLHPKPLKPFKNWLLVVCLRVLALSVWHFCCIVLFPGCDVKSRYIMLVENAFLLWNNSKCQDLVPLSYKKSTFTSHFFKITAPLEFIHFYCLFHLLSLMMALRCRTLKMTLHLWIKYDIQHKATFCLTLFAFFHHWNFPWNLGTFKGTSLYLDLIYQSLNLFFYSWPRKDPTPAPV